MPRKTTHTRPNRLFADYIQELPHDADINATSDALLQEVLRWRNALSSLQPCPCLRTRRPPGHSCRTLQRAEAFVRAVDLLGYREAVPLIEKLSESPKSGAELARYVTKVGLIIRCISDAYARYGNDIENWPRETRGTYLISPIKGAKPERESSMPDRSRSTRKIIFSLAREHYAYDPSNKKNKAASAIEKITEKQGCRVDQDTINTILKEAVQICDDL